MDRPIWVRLLAVLGRNPESTTVTLNRASAEEMLHEIKRLQDGGCARDQGLTQYCAEAAVKDAEITALKAEVERKDAALKSAVEVADEALSRVSPYDAQIINVGAKLEKARAALTQEKTDV